MFDYRHMAQIVVVRFTGERDCPTDTFSVFAASENCFAVAGRLRWRAAFIAVYYGADCWTWRKAYCAKAE